MSTVRTYLKARIDMSTSLAIGTLVLLMVLLPVSIHVISKVRIAEEMHEVEAAGYNASLTVSAPLSVKKGSPFDAIILLNTNGGAIRSADVVLDYDPQMFAVEKIIPMAQQTTTLKTILPQSSSGSFDEAGVIANAKKSKQIRFSAIAMDPANQMHLASYTGVTQLAILRLRPLKAGISYIGFHYDQSTSDTNINSLSTPPVDFISGQSQLLNASITIDE